MLFYGRAQKVAVFAVDTATGVGKTGDVSNFTLQVSKDGAANASASNTPTEIGYGLYSLELTASECSADLVCVSGVSSTSGVSISPIIATTEAQAIPYATAGAASGLALTSSVDDCETKIDSVLEDTGTTLPATLATIDTNVDSVLVDTGTTLPASLSTIDTNIDSVLVDTGTTLPATLATIDTNVDSVLEDTGTTLPATLSTIDTNIDSVKLVTDALPDSGALSSLATASALSTVSGNVDSVLVDTGTTLPATLSTISGNVDSVLVDTGTTLPASLSTIDTNIDSVLEDTGTSLPATLATIDTNVDSVLEDTGTTLPATLSTLATSSALSTVDTVVDSISSSLSSGVTCVAVSSAAVEDVFSTHAIAEEYSADGSSSATPGALLWLIQQALTEFAISGTSVTIKKADGSTTAAVYTLDSSTSPTSRTRAS